MGIFLNRAGVASSNAQYTAGPQITTESFMYEDYVDDYSYAYADLMESIAMFDSGVADSVVTEAAGGFGAAIGAFMNTVLGKVIVLIGVVIAVIVAFIAAKNSDSGGSGKSDDKDSGKGKPTIRNTTLDLTLDQIKAHEKSICDSVAKGYGSVIDKAKNSTLTCDKMYADLITGNISSVKSKLDAIAKLSGEITKKIPEVNQMIDDAVGFIKDINTRLEDRHFGETNRVISGSQMIKDETIKFKQKYDNIVGVLDGDGIFNEIKASINRVIPEDVLSDKTSVSIKDIKDATFDEIMSIGSSAKSVSGELSRTESLLNGVKDKSVKISRVSEELDRSYSVAIRRYDGLPDAIKDMNHYYNSYKDLVYTVRDTVHDMSTSIITSLKRIRFVVDRTSIAAKIYNGNVPSFKLDAMGDAIRHNYPDKAFETAIFQFVKKSDIEALSRDSIYIETAVLNGLELAEKNAGCKDLHIRLHFIAMGCADYLRDKFNLKK